MFLPQVLAVDSTFFQIFDFKLLSGDSKTALLEPNSIVLTQTTAKKLFGNSSPIGKTLIHNEGDTVNFKITGIVADAPQNSQLQFDALYSFSSTFKPWMNNWGGNWLNTYVVLKPGTDVASLESKMPDYLKKHITQNEGWKFYELFFSPLTDVHANTADIGLDYLNYQKFDGTYTDLFACLAVVVLVIACVNFINLTTARSTGRAREVGVRKSIGAQKLQLTIQFLSETVILTLIALLIAILLVELALPYVNSLSQRSLSLNIINNPLLIPGLAGVAIIIGILSGLYPAVVLSSFKPVKVLKGAFTQGRNKANLRNALVVVQFTSAVFLMIATVFVVKQLRFMQQRDPGFTRDQIVTIKLDRVSSQHYEQLKQDLLSQTVVQGVTGAQDVLGSHLDQSGVEFQPANGPLRQLATTRLIVDKDFLNLYNIKLAAGQNFFKDGSGNGREYIINEALAKELLKETPKAPLRSLLGKHFGFDSLGVITGIAKNFNFNSMHHKIETMFMYTNKDWGYSNMSVKISAGKTAEALALIKAKWQQTFPDRPFDYEFVDDHFNDVYRADNQVSQVVGILAGLAILISCLGLLGLAAYSAQRRVKELGIRKILGASSQNLVMLFSGQFIKLVLLANIIALPIAWFTLHKWLNGFAYRIAVEWQVFLLVAIASVAIALITIGLQSIKAALINPVKNLRTD